MPKNTMTKLLILSLLLLANVAVAMPSDPPKYDTSEAIENAIITAYSASPDETDDTPRIMASGKEVYEGAIACPRKYPFGTKMGINGSIFTCEDRKHWRYDTYENEWFDVFIDSKAEAKQFGIWYNQKVVIQ